MANARGKEIDGTHLSVEQANARGFLHRDYIAHCLRWTKICKDMNKGAAYRTSDIIDVGCGKDMPLARTLMTSRMAPRSYTGIEWNKMDVPSMFDNTSFKPKLIQDVDFTELEFEDESFNVGVCLEVLEHVEPLKAIAIIDKMAEVVGPSGVCYFSTPCYDEKVGHADNHVNEMTYEAVGSLLEARGYHIVEHYGTFASMKDYKPHMDEATKVMFDSLREYYDTNYLATIFAPLYPEHSRNVIWKCIPQSIGPTVTRFPEMKNYTHRLGSSEKWEDLLSV